MKITVGKTFVWWNKGIRRVEYQPGECDVDDDCARYAIAQGFASVDGAGGGSDRKSLTQLKKMNKGELVGYAAALGLMLDEADNKDVMIAKIEGYEPESAAPPAEPGAPAEGSE